MLLVVFVCLFLFVSAEAMQSKPSPGVCCKAACASQMLCGQENGFVSLFDGKSLDGWHKHVQLNQGKWAVKDGAIVGIQYPVGKGGFLCTDGTYRDFELTLETQIDWPFDSGVFLRVGEAVASHQVTLDYRPGGEVGGIYIPFKGRAFVQHCAKGVELFKKGEWNKLRIICQGEPARIQVYLNGDKITDYTHTAETAAGLPAEGSIALQVHPGGKGWDDSRAMFRNIKVRELVRSEVVSRLTAEEKAEGFECMFNGKDLTGWNDKGRPGWSADNGVLVCREKIGDVKGGGNLYTKKDYSDFIFRFEFKLEANGNNGIGLRVPMDDTSKSPSYLGMELQILDTFGALYSDPNHPKYYKLKPYQVHGSIYGVVPAITGYLKPVGQWNYEEIVACGSRIKVNVNGATIVDADISKTEAIDGHPENHTGLKRKDGRIVLLGHVDHVEFRNLRVRDISGCGAKVK